MDMLLHKMVSVIIIAALLAFVGWLSTTVRKRKVARQEAAAPAPAEDRSQTLLRQAQQFDFARDSLAAKGQHSDALAQAQAAANSWRELTEARPGRFQPEHQAAAAKLDELRRVVGHA